jgi:hypothetical protein
MNVNTLEQIVSKARLQPYIVSQPQNPERAVALYEQNIALAQSFYPLLSSLEVALRNALDKQCSALFADPNWLTSQKTGFMVASRLTYIDHSGKQRTNDFLKRSIEEAESTLRRQKKILSQGRIISELTFGFWTELFDRTHYSLLKGVPIKIFPNLPPTIRRVQIYDRLRDIRRFRNRIYHNEPICFVNGMCDLAPAEKIGREALDLISWLSADMFQWISVIDHSQQEILKTKQF